MSKSTISDNPVREQAQFLLRLPEGMREEIKAAADINGRSMNSEIIARLSTSGDLRDWFAGQALAGMLCNGFRPSSALSNDKVTYPNIAFEMADSMLAARKVGGK